MSSPPDHRHPDGLSRASPSSPTYPLSFRFHARALAALGRDLVTNDVVAVMELVKNAYDAMAKEVEVRIRADDNGGGATYIEIVDDGHGMDYDTIAGVWCVIATPFRAERPVAAAGRRARQVTGEKGLGRLSAARLGGTLEVITRVEGGPSLRFSLDWDELLNAGDLARAAFTVAEVGLEHFIGGHGTRVRIGALRSNWTEERIHELRQGLARLVSPFMGAEDFRITLHTVEIGDGEPVEIAAPAFISAPKYLMAGGVDGNGMIRAEYRFRPLGERLGRDRSVCEAAPATGDPLPLFGVGDDRRSGGCGPFEFELRAWDLTPDDTRDIAEHFDEQRRFIRDAIRSHCGISVYRDHVLVLPKSTKSQDWLGLDLRRVSRVGPRLSTSQIVGYVRITKAGNPGLQDTSDREGLVSNPMAEAFRERMTRVVQLLEDERNADRLEEKDRATETDLFANLNAEALVEGLKEIRDRGDGFSDAIKLAKQHGRELAGTRAAIERRFGYYSRLAVIGTIAQMVIHEIRNRTSVIGPALRKAGQLADRVSDAALQRSVDLGWKCLESLDALADRFAPLASRGYRPGRRTSVLEESIARCVEMQAGQVRSGGITVELPSDTRTAVRIDPGELDAVMTNLLLNALYWIRRADGDRRLRFRLLPGPSPGRVSVRLDDTGSGIDPDDAERVFWPGVTRKPDGFGMGLTVAAELVRGRGGQMRTEVPGKLGGATIEFDLPLVPRRKGT